MGFGWYRLEGKVPVPCDSMRAVEERWREESKNPDSWRVAETTIGDLWISTVFLGLDHNMSLDGPPILFETMIFGKEGAQSEEQWRCSTWEEAERQHAEVVERVKVQQEAHGQD